MKRFPPLRRGVPLGHGSPLTSRSALRLLQARQARPGDTRRTEKDARDCAEMERAHKREAS